MWVVLFLRVRYTAQIHGERAAAAAGKERQTEAVRAKQVNPRVHRAAAAAEVFSGAGSGVQYPGGAGHLGSDITRLRLRQRGRGVRSPSGHGGACERRERERCAHDRGRVRRGGRRLEGLIVWGHGLM